MRRPRLTRSAGTVPGKPLLEWRVQASLDLIRIVTTIADDNIDAAQALKDEIEAKAARLPEHPVFTRRQDGSRARAKWSSATTTSCSTGRLRNSWRSSTWCTHVGSDPETGRQRIGAHRAWRKNIRLGLTPTLLLICAQIHTTTLTRY